MPQIIKPDSSAAERLAFAVGRYEDAKNILLEIADALDHVDVPCSTGRLDAVTLAAACVEAEQGLFRLHEQLGGAR